MAHVGGVIALVDDPLPCLLGDGAPVDGGLAEPDADAPAGWKRQVHRPHLGEEGLIADPMTVGPQATVLRQTFKMSLYGTSSPAR